MLNVLQMGTKTVYIMQQVAASFSFLKIQKMTKFNRYERIRKDSAIQDSNQICTILTPSLSKSRWRSFSNTSNKLMMIIKWIRRNKWTFN